MTNQLALVLCVIIAALITLDLVIFGGSNLIFLGKKLFVLIDWLAFWR